MGSSVFIAIQVLCAAAAGALLVARLLRSVRSSGDVSFVSDVGLALLVTVPLVASAAQVRGELATSGWFAFGGPIIVGAVAVAIAAMGGLATYRPPGGALMRWTCAAVATGLVLVLLAALNELPPLVGQSGLVIAAVLMWINTPDDRTEAGKHAQPLAVYWAAVGLLVLLQAVAVYLAGTDAAAISGVVSLAWALAALAMIGWICGAVAVLRAGGWSAVYGPLLSMSLISVPVVASALNEAVKTGYAVPITRVATGTAGIALEAVALIALPIVVLTLVRAGREMGRLAGVAILVGVAAIVLYRAVSGG